jgi:hypothetical protein
VIFRARIFFKKPPFLKRGGPQRWLSLATKCLFEMSLGKIRILKINYFGYLDSDLEISDWLKKINYFLGEA